MSTPTVRTGSLRIDRQLLWRVKLQAAKEQRTISELVEEAVREYLKRKPDGGKPANPKGGWDVR